MLACSLSLVFVAAAKMCDATRLSLALLHWPHIAPDVDDDDDVDFVFVAVAQPTRQQQQLDAAIFSRNFYMRAIRAHKTAHRTDY